MIYSYIHSPTSHTVGRGVSMVEAGSTALPSKLSIPYASTTKQDI